MEGKPTILLVDDDEALLRTLSRAIRLEQLGTPVACQDPREVASWISRQDIGLVLLDLLMPHLPGEAVLRLLKEKRADIPVIILSAVQNLETAVRCVKEGAFDYLTKPCDLSRLSVTIRNALRQYEMSRENQRLMFRLVDPSLQHPECFEEILTVSPAMRNIFRYMEAIAPSPEPVFIFGETGVGKELIARAIHRLSGRTGPFVAVNVAGIDGTTFSDSLFGHVRGAYTGADRIREGLIEQAAGGTLLLDEIGDLGADEQTKLLRLLQEGEYYPLGADRPRKSCCRFLATTNRDLTSLLQSGRFRADLYYRLQTHLVRIPPLRERPEDIPLLAEHFLRQAAERLGKPIPAVPPEWITYLKTYRFPGNVRELRSLMTDAVSRHEKGIISIDMLLPPDREPVAKGLEIGGISSEQANTANLIFGNVLPTLEEAKTALVQEALRRAGNNLGAAARLLQISRRTLSRYMMERRLNSRQESL